MSRDATDAAQDSQTRAEASSDRIRRYDKDVPLSVASNADILRKRPPESLTAFERAYLREVDRLRGDAHGGRLRGHDDPDPPSDAPDDPGAD